MKQRATPLSLYLVFASLLQISLYVAWTLSPEQLGAIFYFDPRIGLFFIESGFGSELTVPGYLQWLSAIWLLVISLLLVSGRLILKAYIVSEIVATLPNLFFFVLIGLANLSLAHGFSIGELLVPVPMTILFSVVPLLMAIRIMRKRMREISSIPSSAEHAIGMDSL